MDHRRILASAQGGWHRRLPDRYHRVWQEPFARRVDACLRPGMQILDVGPGRRPTLTSESRPPGSRYVALDASPQEMDRAQPGAYDDIVVADVATRVPELVCRFDLIVSWQVLEHVDGMREALEHLRAYLRPGGRLVAFFSGRFSAFALLNVLLPKRLGVSITARVMRRTPDTIFPAHYDGCYHGALERMLSPWSEREIVPEWNGAGYFRFSRALLTAYLAYEEWAVLGDHRNLATHYLVTATK